jgi:undecaprenyl-diphosphatase
VRPRLYARQQTPHGHVGIVAQMARTPFVADRSLTSAHLAAPQVWSVLGLLALAAMVAKVTEDVTTRESGASDTRLLWFVHEHVPPALSGFFAIATRTGSAAFLLAATCVVAAGLLIARHRAQAFLLAASMLTAPLLTYTLKTLVSRSRPSLWDAPTYWGSSFPSGHTLAAASFATAAALCVAQIRPRYAVPALVLALLWGSLVGLSRLVLGVHWPSDVLAAWCLGMFIPLAINLALVVSGPVRG